MTELEIKFRLRIFREEGQQVERIYDDPYLALHDLKLAIDTGPDGRWGDVSPGVMTSDIEECECLEPDDDDFSAADPNCGRCNGKGWYNAEPVFFEGVNIRPEPGQFEDYGYLKYDGETFEGNVWANV